MNSQSDQPGLWASARRLLDTTLAIAQNRVELAAVELQEEKSRLVEAMLLVAALGALGIMGLTLFTIAMVMLFWDQGRLVVLFVLSALYLAGTFFVWHALQRRLKGPAPFSDTIAELRKDRACLQRDN